MQAREPRVLIMAAGTGGHIFPALAIADRLQRFGAEVHWLGTPNGMEQKLLGDSNIPLHVISAYGLRNRGWLRAVAAAPMLLRSLFQALSVMRRVRPGCVLGMGGYVSGPGGVAARLWGAGLVIHEQNAVAGLTNRLLARISTRVLAAFPGSFSPRYRAVVTGNPVRAEIAASDSGGDNGSGRDRQLRLLILGGSRGAAAINEIVPELIANWGGEVTLHTLHQCGEGQLQRCESQYAELAVPVNDRHRLRAFIGDMAGAYGWADLVLCRSGAGTVFELAAAGLPSILVPYPYHKDRQQEKNAQWLVAGDAAHLIPQQQLTTDAIYKLLYKYAGDKSILAEMGRRAGTMATPDAADCIARQCLEVAHGR